MHTSSYSYVSLLPLNNNSNLLLGSSLTKSDFQKGPNTDYESKTHTFQKLRICRMLGFSIKSIVRPTIFLNDQNPARLD